jgi:ankyrin repeat protein
LNRRDPAQLLITFNARLNAQDQNGNTALHYSVAFNNLKVLEVLLIKGASVDVRNKKSQTAYDLAIDTKKFSAANFIRSLSDIDKEALPNALKPLSRNKVTFFFFL